VAPGICARAVAAVIAVPLGLMTLNDDGEPHGTSPREGQASGVTATASPSPTPTATSPTAATPPPTSAGGEPQKWSVTGLPVGVPPRWILLGSFPLRDYERHSLSPSGGTAVWARPDGTVLALQVGGRARPGRNAPDGWLRDQRGARHGLRHRLRDLRHHHRQRRLVHEGMEDDRR
jgi:hypothetical protein